MSGGAMRPFGCRPYCRLHDYVGLMHCAYPKSLTGAEYVKCKSLHNRHKRTSSRPITTDRFQPADFRGAISTGSNNNCFWPTEVSTGRCNTLVKPFSQCFEV